MAIGYTKVGWNTNKVVNPTNMNQMDNGIKSACDAVDLVNNRIKLNRATTDLVGWQEVLLQMHGELANYQNICCNVFYKASSTATSNSVMYVVGSRYSETNGRYLVMFQTEMRQVHVTSATSFEAFTLSKGNAYNYPS